MSSVQPDEAQRRSFDREPRLRSRLGPEEGTMTDIPYEAALVRRDELLREAAKRRLARRASAQAPTARPANRTLRRLRQLGFAARS